jgi:hypothetical protein
VYHLLCAENYHISSDTEATIASIRLECHTRVAILEQRLMDTANELGKAQVRIYILLYDTVESSTLYCCVYQCLSRSSSTILKARCLM